MWVGKREQLYYVVKQDWSTIVVLAITSDWNIYSELCWQVVWQLCIKIVCCVIYRLNKVYLQHLKVVPKPLFCGLSMYENGSRKVVNFVACVYVMQLENSSVEHCFALQWYRDCSKTTNLGRIGVGNTFYILSNSYVKFTKQTKSTLYYIEFII